MNNSLGGLLSQKNDEGQERVLHYLSWNMVDAKNKHLDIKMCLILIYPVKKLRHYLLADKTMPISKLDPIKYIMTRSTLPGNLAKWAILLVEFYILYGPQKAIEGQTHSDFPYNMTIAPYTWTSSLSKNLDYPWLTPLRTQDCRDDNWVMSPFQSNQAHTITTSPIQLPYYSNGKIVQGSIPASKTLSFMVHGVYDAISKLHVSKWQCEPKTKQLG